MPVAKIVNGVTITPEMVEAGIKAYERLDGSAGAVWFWVSEVFAEMAKLSPEFVAAQSPSKQPADGSSEYQSHH